MKKFNWLKGAALCLLALVLVAGSFGAVKAKAADEAKKEYSLKFTGTDDAGKTKTFTAKVASGEAFSVDVAELAVKMGCSDNLFVSRIGEVYEIENASGTAFKIDEVTADAEYTVELDELYNWEYDPIEDAIEIFGNYYYIAAEGTITISYAEVKNNSASLTGSKFKTKTISSSASMAAISLSDKSKGIKVDNNKDAYLRITAATPATAKTAYTANVHVCPAPAKKLKVEINYSVAAASSDALGIASIYTEDANKTKTTLVFMTEEEAVKSKKEKQLEQFWDTIWYMQYSKDGGKSWLDVIYNVEWDNELDEYIEKPELDFVGNNMIDLMTKKAKLQFRITGKSWYYGRDDKLVEAVRTSKPVKVNLKAPAKAGKFKIDASANTIKIGNGCDFAVMTEDVDVKALQISDYFTVLPYKKDEGKATKDIIPTADYVPGKFDADTNANMYTANKVSAIAIDTILAKNASAGAVIANASGGAVDVWVYVRKSAGAGKPAATATKIKLKTPDVAPTPEGKATTKDAAVTTALGVADAKGVFGNGNFTNAEFAIIDKNDLPLKDGEFDTSKIDWTTVKWTSLSKGKGLTTKSKTKYAVVGAKADAHEIADDSLILVRTAGKKNAEFASKFCVTKLAKHKNPADAANNIEASEQTMWVPYDFK